MICPLLSRPDTAIVINEHARLIKVRCVKEDCAWWDNELKQCGMKKEKHNEKAKI